MSAATLSNAPRRPASTDALVSTRTTLTALAVLAHGQADARRLSAGDDERATGARIALTPDRATEGAPMPELDVVGWRSAIEAAIDRPDSTPILNLKDDGDGIYDAIFVGGGAAGRFGGSYLRAMGGRALIIDRWPFLGGSCPHQACVPHHLFSEAAALLDRARWFSDELFFGPFDESRASILRARRAVPRRPRLGARVHELADAGAARRRVRAQRRGRRSSTRTRSTAAGRTFEARNLVIALGAFQKPLLIPGAGLRGVHDWATLVEDLDYEPTRCVIDRRRQDRGRVRLVLPGDRLRDDDRVALAGDAHAQPAPRRRGHPPLRRRRHAAPAA